MRKILPTLDVSQMMAIGTYRTVPRNMDSINLLVMKLARTTIILRYKRVVGVLVGTRMETNLNMNKNMTKNAVAREAWEKDGGTQFIKHVSNQVNITLNTNEITIILYLTTFKKL